MSNIPEARAEIEQVIVKLKHYGMLTVAHELEQARKKLDRKVATRRTPTRLPPLNADQWDHIKRLATTSKSQQDIAVVVGVNAGRVSEVINGLRSRPAT